MEFVLIPPGVFLMGSDKNNYNEKPVHRVTISRPFLLGKYPVTIGQYLEFCQETDTHWPEWLEKGSRFHIREGIDRYYKAFVSGDEEDRWPVVGVSWNNSVAYCEWLGKKHGITYWLPSEAEWEYACRAGTTGDYAGKLEEMGWYDENSGGKTHPVGQKKPNGWGLHDMHGNVWEWCADVWHGNYKGAPTDGSAWMQGGGRGHRVVRGGSWYNYSDECRSAYRNWRMSNNRLINLGFRVVVATGTVEEKRGISNS